MRVLVAGSAGQVGQELMRAAWPAGAVVVGAARDRLDITDAAGAAEAVAASRADIVVNAAAFTAVDAAESQVAAAFAVNRDGAAHLAAACAKSGAALLQISTDYVFDGAKPTPYQEDDAIGPINRYGASKAAGEAAVRDRLDRHIILRTSWVYGLHGRNFVKTMLRLAQRQDEIRVVADQWGAPTEAGDLAAAIATLSARLGGGDALWGTYHFCGGGATTWHGFAERIFALGDRPPPRLIAITTPEFPTPARRPANSRLDCRKIAANFGIVPPPWESSLAGALPAIAGAIRHDH